MMSNHLFSSNGFLNKDFKIQDLLNCILDVRAIEILINFHDHGQIPYAGKGSNPEWNENFVFTISEGVSELKLKIMDSDSGTADDFVGEVT